MCVFAIIKKKEEKIRKKCIKVNCVKKILRKNKFSQ